MGNPKHLWYDWAVLLAVAFVVGAIAFTLADCAFAFRPTRLVVAGAVAICCGILAMSVAEDINIEFRCTRKYKDDKQENR